MLERNTGPRDRASVAERGDVLVYQTPPIAQALEVTGPVAVALWAASDAPTTDFTATLVDAGPDGSARTVCEGIARVGALVEPTPIDISLWSTSWVFLPGHRIRLEVTSSNFPRFDRNLNSGEAPMNATHPQCANQTVYHDEVRPSALLLWATARPDLG
jgi:putative CocE/NonD family hydrolase